MRHRLFENNLIRLLVLGMLYSAFIFGSCKDENMPETNKEKPALEKSIDDININVRALRKVIDVQGNALSIQSYTSFNNREGYIFELSDGSTMTVLTKITAPESGNLSTVYSPKIGVKINNGTYYWTLDGEWMLANGATGKQIPVLGDQGATPVIGVTDDGYWKVTCNSTVNILNTKAQAGQFDSYFSNVNVSDPDCVIFTFADGTPAVTIPVHTEEDPGPSPVTGHLRRIISPAQPMWLVHIDTWLTPDPQQIIDMIPVDIRPYVVFNISLSVSHDENTGKWKVVEDGYETSKSWLRTCAENRVWAVVQPSSGGFSHFPDIMNYTEMETSIYNEFFRDYPNFLGFNYCEQFWGFSDPFSVSYPQRLTHWTNLMKLTHKYGGYLVVSFCNAYWGAALNPIAMMKRDADFADICRQYPENFILCEKYTSHNGFFDTESNCLGTYLSGFSGQYGIRFDECGWNGMNGDEKFPVSAGAIPIVEHVMLTGQTVIDGPETIPRQGYSEVSAIGTDGGYTKRNWEFYPQFTNISIDLFRKILDGTIRIPSRKEVIDRTKVVLIHDVNSGNDLDKYCTPETLYEGLYRMEGDGNLRYNENYFKKTGRYPTIPIVYQLADAEANSFLYKVNKSQYTTKWGNEEIKVREFDALFPQEYTGDLYAGRHENGWVTYNPGGRPNASIPFKYNTCDRMELTYAKYTLGVIKEYANKLTFYLTNYDNADTSLKTDVIKIYGSSVEPTFSYEDRGNHVSSNMVKNWSNNVFTLTVTHNGALDLTVNCSGRASGRETAYQTAVITLPDLPQVYEGTLQYEAENFDYKNITKIQKNGYNSGISNYTAQGYLNFGTKSSASVRKTINVPDAGYYTLRTRYRAPSALLTTIDLYVNGIKVATPEFVRTENRSDVWNVNTQSVNLRKEKNTIEFRANSSAAGDFYLDHIIIEKR